MRIEDTNTYFIGMLLDIVKETDVLRFTEVYPSHKEATDAYWLCKRELNVDNFFNEDLVVLKQCLERSPNLTKIKYKNIKIGDAFSAIPQYVVQYCRSVEILDLPGLSLSQTHLELFSSYRNLKKVNFKMSAFTVELNTIFLNNPHLEDVCLNGFVREDCFKSTPKNIKKFELHNKLKAAAGDLFENIASWKLEKLSLPETRLTVADIRRLHTQNMLVSVDLLFSGDEGEFEALFANNQSLEDVTVRSLFRSTFKGTCLRSLPPLLKRLRIHTHSTIEGHHLVDCLKIRDIDELVLDDRRNTYEFLSELLSSAPNLKVLEINSSHCAPGHLSAIQQLTKLKTLRLTELKEQHGQALTEITQNCLTLEKLTLAGARLVPVTFRSEVLYSVAILPRLKKVNVGSFRGSESFNMFLHYLASSQQLCTVKFMHCEDLTDGDLLILLRGCETLTKIKIISCNGISIRLPWDMTKVLSRQPNRTDFFHFVLDYCSKLCFMDMAPSGLHPLLQIRLWRKK